MSKVNNLPKGENSPNLVTLFGSDGGRKKPDLVSKMNFS
jgi:hypothetical protein